MTTQVFVPPSQLQTAVLFLVFNRPDTTKQVFEAIRQARPSRLYVAADGAREGKPGESERVEQVRKIATEVDWPCEVKTLFREKNLGCKKAVSTGINWFFNNEEQGIILEDDCLPSVNFFNYCEELLIRYKNSENIGIISGSYYFFDFTDRAESYYFSVYPYIWGWATWRRVWEIYDVDMNKYNNSSSLKMIKNSIQTKEARSFWFKSFQLVYQKKIDTWDYQLFYSLMQANLLNIVPTKNLITNIGFGLDATHTTALNSDPHSNMIRYEIDIPLKHPLKILRSLELDLKFEMQAFKRQNFIARLIKKINGIFK